MAGKRVIYKRMIDTHQNGPKTYDDDHRVRYPPAQRHVPHHVRPHPARPSRTHTPNVLAIFVERDSTCGVCPRAGGGTRRATFERGGRTVDVGGEPYSFLVIRADESSLRGRTGTIGSRNVREGESVGRGVCEAQSHEKTRDFADELCVGGRVFRRVRM